MQIDKQDFKMFNILHKRLLQRLLCIILLCTLASFMVKIPMIDVFDAPVSDQAMPVCGISAVRIITPSYDTASTIITNSLLREHIPDAGWSPAFMNVDMTSVSLLNRVLYENGVHFTGKQIANTRQAGCFLAHLFVWQSIPPGETWLIMEDDAVVFDDSVYMLAQVMRQIGACVSKDRYDVINFAPSVVRNAPTCVPDRGNNMSVCVRECPRDDRSCFVLGAVAYVITYSGAQKLIKHALPMELTLDWYMTLFASFVDPEFQYGFVDAVFGHSGRPSRIGYNCILCNLPQTGLGMVAFLSILSLLSFGVGVACMITWNLPPHQYNKISRVRPISM